MEIDFHNPDPNNIFIDDIAHSLSHICRFTGAIPKFYSVAQHCCICAMHVPKEFKLTALLHDAAEAFIQDVNSPLKKAMREIAETTSDYSLYGVTSSPYDIIEERMNLLISEKFGTIYPFPLEVIEADLRALATEATSFGCLDRAPKSWDLPFPAYKKLITPQTSKTAKKKFLELFHSLTEG